MWVLAQTDIIVGDDFGDAQFGSNGHRIDLDLTVGVRLIGSHLPPAYPAFGLVTLNLEADAGNYAIGRGFDNLDGRIHWLVQHIQLRRVGVKDIGDVSVAGGRGVAVTGCPVAVNDGGPALLLFHPPDSSKAHQLESVRGLDLTHPHNSNRNLVRGEKLVGGISIGEILLAQGEIAVVVRFEIPCALQLGRIEPSGVEILHFEDCTG